MILEPLLIWLVGTVAYFVIETLFADLAEPKEEQQ